MSMSAVGRDREFAAVPTFLDGIEGRSGVLQFAGPAGIGKTTLWEEAVAAARARGHRVVVARPTEVETALAFAALNDLLSPNQSIKKLSIMRRTAKSRTTGIGMRRRTS